MAIAIIGLVVGVVSAGVGIAQKEKANNLQKEAAIRQREQNVLLANKDGFDRQVIGVRQDATMVVNEIFRGRIDAEAQVQMSVQAASASKQGDILLLVAGMSGILVLGVLVFGRSHKQT